MCRPFKNSLAGSSLYKTSRGSFAPLYPPPVSDPTPSVVSLRVSFFRSQFSTIHRVSTEVSTADRNSVLRKHTIPTAIMRHGFSSVTKKLLGAAILAFYFQANISNALPEDSPGFPKVEDDNSQAGTDLVKRNWDKNLKMWGKRAWSNLHGGWGLKRSPQEDFDDDSLLADKRSWENLRNGWGKRRLTPDDLTPQELSILESEYPDNENVYEYNDDEKRSWNQLNNGWGKRNKWSEFRGVWGKRGPDPAWNNLKGIWGKRSYADKVLH